MNDYTAKSGDTYSAIAAKNGISISALKAANDGIEMSEGQQITIPMASNELKLEDCMDYFEKSSAHDGDDY